jgi:hypothetical protein
MLRSKHLVVECNIAQGQRPQILTYVLEALAISTFKVVQEDQVVKEEYFWSTLKMEAASSSKTLVTVYHCTWCHARRLGTCISTV